MVNCPCNRLFRPVADAGGVAVVGEVAAGGDIEAFILRIIAQDGGHLLAGDGSVWLEGAVVKAINNADAGGPVHGLGVPVAVGHVGEVTSAGLRIAFQTMEHSHEHGAAEAGVRFKGRRRGAGHEAVVIDVAHRIVEPVVRAHVGEWQGGAAALHADAEIAAVADSIGEQGFITEWGAFQLSSVFGMGAGGNGCPGTVGRGNVEIAMQVDGLFAAGDSEAAAADVDVAVVGLAVADEGTDAIDAAGGGDSGISADVQVVVIEQGNAAKAAAGAEAAASDADILFRDQADVVGGGDSVQGAVAHGEAIAIHAAVGGDAAASDGEGVVVNIDAGVGAFHNEAAAAADAEGALIVHGETGALLANAGEAVVTDEVDGDVVGGADGVAFVDSGITGIDGGVSEGQGGAVPFDVIVAFVSACRGHGAIGAGAGIGRRVGAAAQSERANADAASRCCENRLWQQAQAKCRDDKQAQDSFFHGPSSCSVIVGCIFFHYILTRRLFQELSHFSRQKSRQSCRFGNIILHNCL